RSVIVDGVPKHFPTVRSSEYQLRRSVSVDIERQRRRALSAAEAILSVVEVRRQGLGEVQIDGITEVQTARAEPQPQLQRFGRRATHDVLKTIAVDVIEDWRRQRCLPPVRNAEDLFDRELAIEVPVANRVRGHDGPGRFGVVLVEVARLADTDQVVLAIAIIVHHGHRMAWRAGHVPNVANDLGRQIPISRSNEHILRVSDDRPLGAATEELELPYGERHTGKEARTGGDEG